MPGGSAPDELPTRRHTCVRAGVSLTGSSQGCREAEEGGVGQTKKARVVEVEPSVITWRRSTASGGNGQACVEVAQVAGSTLVRNSRNPRGARLSLPNRAWTALLARVHSGNPA